jgi:hypothetical protein
LLANNFFAYSFTTSVSTHCHCETSKIVVTERAQGNNISRNLILLCSRNWASAIAPHAIRRFAELPTLARTACRAGGPAMTPPPLSRSRCAPQPEEDIFLVLFHFRCAAVAERKDRSQQTVS